jgi:iron complex transport system permease protein
MQKRSLFFTLNLLILIGVIAISISVGASQVQGMVSAIFHPSAKTTASEIVWQIRIPRIATALLVGAALGVAGAIAQGATNNPLAEPAILGSSAGAALAVVIGVLANVISIGSVGAMAIATLGALAATLVTFRFAVLNRQVSSLNLIIIGLSVSATISALVGILTSAVTRADARSISFWNFGSLALTNSSDILPLLIFTIIGIAIAIKFAPKLDVLSLGDLTAKHLGVDPRRIRFISLVALSILIGAAVSTVGTIAFLGLAVPHIVRLIDGPKHRPLIIQSALLGATVLLIADTLARTIAKPNELNVGLFTALIGAPVLASLVRNRKSSWSHS